MSTDFNITIDYDTRDDIDEQLLEAFAAYHPATGRSTTGKAQVIITVPGADVVQLLQTTAAIVAQQHHAPVLGVEVITTEEFDRRNGVRPLPELVSVSQAADIAGVSRQAILQRLESGSLAGTKVGTTWVVQRDHITGPKVTERILEQVRRDSNPEPARIVPS